MRTRGMLACGAALAALWVASPLSAQPDSKPDPRTRGFLVSYFMPSMITGGKDACPHGLNIDPKETYLASLSPKARAAAKLFPTQKLYDLSSRNKDGVDLCGDPYAGPDPG